jgi:hypothetical protein
MWLIGTHYRGIKHRNWSLLKGVFEPEECDSIAAMYLQDQGFRSKVMMARHGFGKGEYKYFSYPLPKLVNELRTTIYPKLVPIANRWNELMKIDVRYPDDHTAYIDRCHKAQARPGQHRCCCNTGRTIITACTKTFMVSMCFPCRRHSCYRSRARILRAANSC